MQDSDTLINVRASSTKYDTNDFPTLMQNHDSWRDRMSKLPQPNTNKDY